MTGINRRFVYNAFSCMLLAASDLSRSVRQAAVIIDGERRAIESRGARAALRFGMQARTMAYAAWRVTHDADAVAAAIRSAINGDDRLGMRGVGDLIADDMVAAHLLGARRTAIIAGPNLRGMRLAAQRQSVFAESIRWLVNRLQITEADLERLRNGYIGEARRVARLMATQLEQAVKASLLESTLTGRGAREGVRVLRDVFRSEGFVPAKDYTLEAIFRTQTQLAYAAGRWNAQQDAAVQDILWGFQYAAILDDRVTVDICLPLDGMIRGKFDPVWQRLTPPNHWNCRSTVIELFDSHRETPVPVSVQPQRGFDRLPGLVNADLFGRSVNWRGARSVKRFSLSGPNCGTGAGGFKPGNTCAAGDSSGGTLPGGFSRNERVPEWAVGSNAYNAERRPFAAEWIGVAARNSGAGRYKLFCDYFNADHVVIGPANGDVKVFLMEALGRANVDSYRGGWQLTSEEASWLGFIKDEQSITVRTLAKRATDRASFKLASTCGAGVPGSPGFQPGNTCGAEPGGTSEGGPIPKNAKPVNESIDVNNAIVNGELDPAGWWKRSWFLSAGGKYGYFVRIPAANHPNPKGQSEVVVMKWTPQGVLIHEHKKFDYILDAMSYTSDAVDFIVTADEFNKEWNSTVTWALAEPQQLLPGLPGKPVVTREDIAFALLQGKPSGQAEDGGAAFRVAYFINGTGKVGYAVRVRSDGSGALVREWIQGGPGKVPAQSAAAKTFYKSVPSDQAEANQLLAKGEAVDAEGEAARYLQKKLAGSGRVLTEDEWFDTFMKPQPPAADAVVADRAFMNVRYYRNHWMQAGKDQFKAKTGVEPVDGEKVDQVETWVRTLSEDEDNALDNWGGGGYDRIQAIEKRFDDPTEDDQVKALYSALDRAPVYEGKVMRGGMIHEPEKVAARRKMYTPGNIIESVQTESWTRAEKVVASFSGRKTSANVVSAISRVVSKSGRYVAPALHHLEEEIIYKKGAKFRVKSFREYDLPSFYAPSEKITAWDIELEEL